jgi:YidC/Oxa1 family membrane protein insertase
VKSWLLTEKEKRKDGTEKYKYTDDNGKPFDLVNPTVASQLGNPLSFFAYDKELEKKLNESLYAGGSASGSTSGTLTYEFSDGDVTVRKTFRPDKDNILSVETEVLRNGARVAAFPKWASGLGDQMAPASYTKSRVDYQQGSTLERKDPTSGGIIKSKKWIVGGETVPGPLDWAATADQYFAVAFLPDSPKDSTLVTLNSQAEVPKNPDKPNEGNDKANVVGLAFGNTSGPTRVRVFAGAKAVDMLESIQSHPGGPDLRGIYDFGTFSFIARPLFLWLKWTYNHIVHNWGWAIVIQTLIISIALLPLRITQMKSMLKMQRVAPQIKSIQEKYKKYSLRDPRKAAMNEEISALYKKEGVNPAGGCLPLLIQFPFLIAYYRMLGVALDLRHAHWLWVSDLSARDPYFILPILMVVSMFAMQRMTPQAGMDPQQQKMMNWMMPVMMGFIFFNLQAGLNLYYAETNLISMAQQALMNRTKLGREMREMLEKRARKKAK